MPRPSLSLGPLAALGSPALGALALGALFFTLLALWMDRRRGIGPVSFLPWDFLMIGGALATLIVAVLWLRTLIAG